jgi:hypothetical protein
MQYPGFAHMFCLIMLYLNTIELHLRVLSIIMQYERTGMYIINTMEPLLQSYTVKSTVILCLAYCCSVNSCTCLPNLELSDCVTGKRATTVC